MRCAAAPAAQIVTCTNTISGRKYREDPTIFGWDIMNE